MSKLTRRINHVKADLAKHDAKIARNRAILKEKFQSPEMIYSGMIGCLILGYALSRKKNARQLFGTFVILPLKMKQYYLNAKYFLPYLGIHI